MLQELLNEIQFSIIIQRRMKAEGFLADQAVYFQFANKACIGLTTSFTINDPDLEIEAFYCYDPQVEIWQKIASFPFPAAVLGDATFEFFSINNRGYVLLPTDENNFWEYNSMKDSWTQRKDFPGGARQFALSYSSAGFGYVGLGRGFNGQVRYRDIWQYIPETED